MEHYLGEFKRVVCNSLVSLPVYSLFLSSLKSFIVSYLFSNILPNSSYNVLSFCPNKTEGYKTLNFPRINHDVIWQSFSDGIRTGSASEKVRVIQKTGNPSNSNQKPDPNRTLANQ